MLDIRCQSMRIGGRLMNDRKTRVLFIEDEQNLLNSISFILEREGFEVRKAKTGEVGLQAMSEFQPDLVLLDLNLPGMDGFEVAESLVADCCPQCCPAIIIMTGRDAEEDMVTGLERFADDYIVKPVQPRVLIARIQSVLRRMDSLNQSDATIISGIGINRDAFEVHVDGSPVKLTKSEFHILDLLMRAPGKVLSRTQIINAVRGIDCYVTDRIVDFQICRIRKKLGPYGDTIQTVRGIGYKFSAGESDSC